uniref:CCHC-type domain-containing protein n=1 Tax=Ananas comosus var. bracteatus TaxID=296719 RepID=A0A6V7NJA0_ANACO|nr:unnamed protein product [Ananas comosus var. bracteatus]
MFVLKTTIEEELLEHIKEADTPKAAWDTFASLFSKKNDARLQLLENELMTIAQGNMTISQYFMKKKRSSNRRAKKCEAAEGVQWGKTKVGREPPYTGVYNQKEQNTWQFKDDRRQSGECYNCGKKGHFARDCWHKKKQVQGNMTTSGDHQAAYKSEEEWDAQASFAIMESEEDCHSDKEEALEEQRSENTAAKEMTPGAKKEKLLKQVPVYALTTIENPREVNYSTDWIIDSGYSNHMTGDRDKLLSTTEYKGGRVVVTANNSKLPITHIGKTIITPRFSPHQVQLQNVYHVPGMKKNLLSVSQLTASGNYVVFGPQDVKVFRSPKISGIQIMEGKKVESIYVMSAESAYVEKTQKSETADLWHARLGHVGYYKLKIMMERSMLKGLPQLEVRGDKICAGCQFGKAHQLPYTESKYRAKAIRCIFVGYDSERKGWRCCDPTTGCCYTSRNVVFDEASSWWPSQEVILPNSEEIEIKLQEKLEEQEQEGEKAVSEQEESGQPSTESANDEQQLQKSPEPWRTGVHYQTLEEYRPSQLEDIGMQLRRSSRQRKPNPKYANVAIAEEEETPKESASYEEAVTIKEWRNAMDERIQALQQNQNRRANSQHIHQRTKHRKEEFRKQLGMLSKATLRES